MTSFGDRTLEFNSLAQSLKTKGHQTLAKRKDGKYTNRININKIAAEIGKDTQATAQKLQVLTRLAQSKSLFDDPSDKIEELTGIIKMDIQAIRRKLENMTALATTNPNQSSQSAEHNGAIVEALTGNLGETTMQFAKILELRTENLKSQQDRKERFTGTNRMTFQPVAYQPFNPSLDDEPSQEEESLDSVSITLPLVQTREQMLESRSQSIRAVERTVEELRGIMTQISIIARQQDELIVRIDDDITKTEMHVDNAYSELVKYIPKVTGNRWLFAKIFAILIIFVILFIVFFV